MVNMRADAESEQRDDPEPVYALEQLLQTCPRAATRERATTRQWIWTPEKNAKTATLSVPAPAPQVRKRKRKTRKADRQDHSLPSQSQSASPEKRRLEEDAASPVARPCKRQRKAGAVDLSGYTDGRGDLVTKNMDWSEQQLLGQKVSESKSTSVSTFRPRKRGAPRGHRWEGYQLDQIMSHSTVVTSSQFTFRSDVRPSQSGFQGATSLADA
ncbi:hypothetical protein K438DRAFT_1994398 [Mycena galopus ATCC 62051]|nr:hypothetical protein K438DRAFT_1994398 [Mycena galopus ATCC 62051]